MSIATTLQPTIATGQDSTLLTPIYVIQGDAAASPLRGQRVNSAGVVTAVGPRGFYMQEPTGDGRAETSDGIYVYTNRAPDVRAGQCVLVRDALVDEYYDKTELAKVASFEPANLCNPGAPSAAPLPEVQFGADMAARFEPLEGMLVATVALTGVVQGPTKRFATGDVELAVIPQRLAPYVVDGRIQQADATETALLLYLSGALGVPLPDAHWGDLISFSAPARAADGAPMSPQAILDYNFGKYQILLLPGTPIRHTGAVRHDDTVRPPQPGEFSVCSFNLHGMGTGDDQYPIPGEYEVQLRKRASVIAAPLQGCTIVALQETGQPADAAALARLLADEFGLRYTATALPGPQSSVSQFPLTNGLLTRDDQVTVVAAHSPQGCSPVNYDVFDAPGACPAGQYGLFDRPPLVADVQVRGPWGAPIGLRVIDNHWKSKGGDEAVNAPRRQAQAEFVAGLAQAPLLQNPAAAVIVVGDLNDYLGSAPVEIVRTRPEPDLEQAYDWLPRLDRYSYIFDGASQALDHLLFSPALLDSLAEVNVVRVSADYAMPAVDAPENFLHASDHDPILVRFRPGTAAWLGGNLRHPGIAVTAQSAGAAAPVTAITDANGDFRLWNLTAGAPVTVTLAAPDHIILPADPGTLTLRTGGNTYSAQPLHAAVQAGAAVILATAMPDGIP